MVDIKRTDLFGRLSPIAYKAIESATVLCKMRSNPYVELVHWLTQILAAGDSDLHQIVNHFGLDASRLTADLTAAMDRLPRGATAISDFSDHIEHAIKEGFMYANLLYRESAVRTGHLVVGCGKSKALWGVVLQASREFAKINIETLSGEMHKICAGSPEEAGTASADQGLDGAPGEASGAMAPAAMGKQEALARFTRDLTEAASEGEMDPVLGRDEEIRKIIDILMRRRQNNPILTGEAGVGKTAVVEGFAQRIAAGDVPPALQGVAVKTLDLALLQAGASMKGEFENRLKQVIEEVQGSQQPIILFIDEAHTLIGAGGSAGQGDAANLLKPALARGQLRTIAATTWAEYKKYFEKDPALARRFQNILVEEPSNPVAVRMLRGMAARLERHHQVTVLDSAIEAAVSFSRRYIPSRQLPDKAVSVLDTACARVAISLSAEPASLERCRRQLEAIAEERGILEGEVAVGIDHAERLEALAQEAEDLATRRNALAERWQQEKALVDRIIELRAELRSEGEAIDEPPRESGSEAETDSAEAPAGGQPPDDSEPSPDDSQEAERAAQREQLTQAEQELEALQGDDPLILPAVDDQAVAVIIGEWTGIPIGRMVKNEICSVLDLATTLRERVKGQDAGLQTIAKRIQTARAGLADPHKPIAVVMLAGPSGVGKTETALALAETLYGGEQNLITINMSEFQEAHTVSTLKGAPPGYVGYGEGGVLTEAVRRRPYSVVLLDEVEKAHPDVHEIFFQVFDKGHMEDGEGRGIDFRNTVIILTTNVGTDEIMNLCADPDLLPTADKLSDALRPALLKAFPAALVGRMVVVPYYPLFGEVLREIILLKLGKVVRRVREHYNVPLTIDDSVPAEVARRATQLESGARMIDAIITNTLLPRISQEFLQRTADGSAFTAVTISAKDGTFSYDFA